MIGVCITCDSRVYGVDVDEVEECGHCKGRAKCGSCRKVLAVSNGQEYCRYCDPITFAITQEDEKPERVIATGHGEEMELRMYAEVAAQCQRYSRTKIVYTLWGQSYYGPEKGRTWEKKQVITLQKNPKGQSVYRKELQR